VFGVLPNKVFESRWSDVFVYFKHEERGEDPRLAAEMIRTLDSRPNP
jgi:hypothetical protein